MNDTPNVSQVQPDGSLTGLNPEPNSEGILPVSGTDDRYQARQDAETALDDRLGEIFDKNNPEGGDEGKVVAKGEVKRDEIGRFTKDQTAAGAADKAKTTDAKTLTEGDKSTEKTDGQDKPATVQLPRSWSPTEKPLWDSLAPDVQAKLADREMQVSQVLSRNGQALAAFRPLGELLVKNKDVFAKHGAPPVQGVERLIKIQRALDDNPVGTVAAIIKQYKVPLKALSSALGLPTIGPDGKPIPVDPRDREIARLREQQEQINRRLEGRDQEISAERQAYEAQVQEAVSVDVETWGSDKPYFEHVRGAMSVLVANDMADDLDQAYDMACNADPEVRKALAADKVAAEAKKRETDEAAKKKADRDARDKHVSAAKRARTVQLGGTQRQTARSSPDGKWSDNGYLENLFDRVTQAS